MTEAATAVTDADFQRIVLENEQPVLVDFWAPWCPPCRVMSPVVEELAADYSGSITVAKLNVDDSPAASEQFGIQSIATLMLFREGHAVERIVGVVSRQHLRSILDDTLARARGAA